MAKQKPAAKKSATTKPTEGAIQTKAAPVPHYDNTAFANKSIKHITDRVNSDFAAHADIRPFDYEGASVANRTGYTFPSTAGRGSYKSTESDISYPNRRNEMITETFKAKSPVTGQVGVSQKAYKANFGELRKMDQDNTYLTTTPGNAWKASRKK